MKAWFLTLAGAVCLQAQIAVPNPGIARFSGLPLQTILGVSGNLLLANSGLSPAEAAAFANSAGLIAGGGLIRFVTSGGTVLGTCSYRGSAPLLNIESTPATAVAWLPEEQKLLRWTDGECTSSSLMAALPGRVTSVALLSTKLARLLIAAPDATVSAIDIALPAGEVVSASVLPAVGAPAFAFGEFMIWPGTDGLEIQQANGLRQTLAAPHAPFTAERMSHDWVHLYFPAQNRHFALHLRTDQSSLSLLPVPAAKVTR
jgi:hypothetical protein